LQVNITIKSFPEQLRKAYEESGKQEIITISVLGGEAKVKCLSIPENGHIFTKHVRLYSVAQLNALLRESIYLVDMPGLGHFGAQGSDEETDFSELPSTLSITFGENSCKLSYQ